jgi:hypothetical protein
MVGEVPNGSTPFGEPALTCFQTRKVGGIAGYADLRTVYEKGSEKRLKKNREKFSTQLREALKDKVGRFENFTSNIIRMLMELECRIHQDAKVHMRKLHRNSDGRNVVSMARVIVTEMHGHTFIRVELQPISRRPLRNGN